jgi:hypothetical protein
MPKRSPLRTPENYYDYYPIEDDYDNYSEIYGKSTVKKNIAIASGSHTYFSSPSPMKASPAKMASLSEELEVEVEEKVVEEEVEMEEEAETVEEVEEEERWWEKGKWRKRGK